MAKILSVRRYETTENLAAEFGVSERTIRRDIQALSLSQPLYTIQGRYNGGVYVLDGYSSGGSYFDVGQKEVVLKIIDLAEKQMVRGLGEKDICILKDIVNKYSIPCANR